MGKGPLSLFKIEERAFIYVLQEMGGSADPISMGRWNTGISIIPGLTKKIPGPLQQSHWQLGFGACILNMLFS